MFFQLTESQITKSQNAITFEQSVLSNSKEVIQAKKNLMSKQHQLETESQNLLNQWGCPPHGSKLKVTAFA